MEKNNKVVSFVIPKISGGGAERVVTVLSSALADMGYDTHVIIHRHSKMEYPISNNVKLIYLDDESRGMGHFAGLIHRLKVVRKYIKDNKIDIIIPFLDSCVVHTFIASRGTKCTFITTLRNNPYERSKQEKRKCDFVAFFADANYVQNQIQKDYFSKRIQKKTFIVPNPVNNTFFEKGKTYSGKIEKLVAIGRLNSQKNYPRLLNAMKIVLEKHPDVSLSIYGEGDLFQELNDKISEMNLDKNVVLCGRSNDITQVLDSHDLFIMSSDYEGMPNSLMESMSYGMPCISVDCPTGPSELIGDCVRGGLVEMDDGTMLAAKINEAIENPAEYEKKGSLARDYMISHFTSENISIQLLNECMKYI